MRIDEYQTLALTTKNTQLSSHFRVIAAFIEKARPEDPQIEGDHYMDFLAKIQFQQMAVTGKGGEMGELLDLLADHSPHSIPDKFKSELGDMCWYTATCANAFGFLLSEVLGVSTFSDFHARMPKIMRGDATYYERKLAGEVGKFIDYMKKVWFHDHPVDLTVVKSKLEIIACQLRDYAWVSGGHLLEDVARGNIEKLKKRYPKGFEAARSINRVEETV